ncbi:MAG: hypothetical protein P4L73_09985 [Caulobacteraceae bacterium]|nr:hypothetical protein [Caulobacteraceae bacterium]
MSIEYAWPSAWRGQGGARRVRLARPSVPWADLAPAFVLGGFPQAFDAFIWAMAAVTVFPQVFFPQLAPTAGLAAGFAVWGLAYLVRLPARALFAGARRRYGAGVLLTGARLLFGVSTFAVAFLPDARQAAWAPALLIACRLAQGLAMGGLADRRIAPGALRAEDLMTRTRIWALTGLVGLVVAAGLFGVMGMALQRPDFLAWGWRYPFVMAIACNLVALFSDLRPHLLEAEKRSSDRPSLRLATVSGAPVDASTARRRS